MNQLLHPLSSTAVKGELAVPIPPDIGIDLAALAVKVKEEPAAIVELHESSLLHARNAGKFLAEAEMNYKKWLAWAQEAIGLSASTVANYVRIHEKWDEIPGRTEANYSQALRALRKTWKPKPPKSEKPPLTPWQQTITERIKKFKIGGKLENIEKFLESFGVLGVAENK